MLFGNVVAGLLAPTLFLHFCLTFPEPREWLKQQIQVALLYLSGSDPDAGLCRVLVGLC